MVSALISFPDVALETPVIAEDQRKCYFDPTLFGIIVNKDFSWLHLIADYRILHQYFYI